MRFDLFSFVLSLPFLAGVLFFLLKTGREEPPALPYSHLPFFEGQAGKSGFGMKATPILFVFGSLFFLMALWDPWIAGESRDVAATPESGKAFYLVLDQSSSMDRSDQPGGSTKLERLKQVSQEFIEKRPRDLIGLAAFARKTDILSPLTLDHTLLLEKLQQLQVVGNRRDDGTAIGYALYKISSILAASKMFGQKEKERGFPSYDIKESAVVLITDGFQFPHPEDRGKRLRTIGIEAAARYAREQGIKLIIVNIDPSILEEDLAPQRRLMERAASETGGQFFAVPEGKDLEDVFASVDSLEASTLPRLAVQKQTRLFSFAPWLIGLGLLFFGAAVIFDTLLFRRVP